MRIFSTLMHNGRKVPKEPVPFQEILPLKLKAGVSGKGAKTSEVCCLYEMSVMFSCFKDNEFQQKMCGKEIEAFQKCYTNHVETKKQRIDKEMKGILTPGEKNLSPKQVNMLLRRYPNA